MNNLPGVFAAVEALELVNDDTFEHQLQVECSWLNGSQQVDDSLFVFNIKNNILHRNFLTCSEKMHLIIIFLRMSKFFEYFT